jgi:hypothetical protein
MKMKRKSIFPVLLCAVLFVASCKKDEQEPPASTGDPRDKFIATWTCQENSQVNSTSTFSVHISKSTTDSTEILFENLYNYGFNFKPYAQVNGNNFVIPSQVISGNTIQGSGSLTGNNTINMSYTVNDGSTVDNATAVLSK